MACFGSIHTVTEFHTQAAASDPYTLGADLTTAPTHPPPNCPVANYKQTVYSPSPTQLVPSVRANPGKHSHVKLPGVLMQFCWQGLSSVSHSSISMHIPPKRPKPLPHVQENPPGVLEHTWGHPPLDMRHSSTSARGRGRKGREKKRREGKRSQTKTRGRINTTRLARIRGRELSELGIHSCSSLVS